MFTPNKYTKIYFQIIHKRKVKQVIDINSDIYFEIHHIIPRSLSGDNSKNNLVRLTAREHFICHYLLTKMIFEKQDLLKMLYAFNMMRTIPKQMKNGRTHNNSVLYETNKKKISLLSKGRFIPPEVGIKISNSKNKNPYKHSEEIKKNLSLKQTGVKRSLDFKTNHSKINTGKRKMISKEGIKTWVKENDIEKYLLNGWKFTLLKEGDEGFKPRKDKCGRNLGFKLSQETKDKMSNSKKGYKPSEIALNNFRLIYSDTRKMIKDGNFKFVKDFDIVTYLLQGWDFSNLQKENQEYYFKAGILEQKIKPSKSSNNFKKMINLETKEERLIHKLLISTYENQNWILKKLY